MSDNVTSLDQIKATLSGVSLTIRKWSPRRACNADETSRMADAVSADRKILHASKDLIDVRHPAWRNVTKTVGQVRSWYDSATMPYVIDGMRLFLRDHRDEIWTKVAEWNATLRLAVVKMDDDREEILAQAAKTLNGLFDASAYPSRWVDAFTIEIREHSIEPPSYLRHSNAEEYRRELARSLDDIRVSMARFEAQCFAQMGEAAQRLAVNLQPGNRIMSANVESFQSLFQRVAQMRFEGTAVFKSAMNDAQDILDGVSAEALRTSGGLKEETRGRLQQLISRYQQLQAVVVEKAKEPETVTV